VAVEKLPFHPKQPNCRDGELSRKTGHVFCRAFFTKAANVGVLEAQFYLALAYLNGAGTQRDYVSSYQWATITQWGGTARGNLLTILEGKMRPEEMAQAKERAAVWLKEHPSLQETNTGTMRVLQ
jgi:hypothetical protein